MKPQFFLNVSQLLSFKGRISRVQYFVYSLIFTALSLSIYFVLPPPVDAPFNGWTFMQWSLAWVFSLLITIVSLPIYVKRSHDIGWSGIPIVVLTAISIIWVFSRDISYLVKFPISLFSLFQNIDIALNIFLVFFSLFLLLKRGESGGNRYGSNPLHPVLSD